MKRQIADPKTFFVILAAFMLIAVQGVTYGQTVSIDPASVESPAAGEQLTLNINITGGTNVAGYEFTVTFDPTALSYVSSAHGDYSAHRCVCRAAGCHRYECETWCNQSTPRTWPSPFHGQMGTAHLPQSPLPS